MWQDHPCLKKVMDNISIYYVLESLRMSRIDKALCFGAFLLFAVAIYVHFLAGFGGDKDWQLVASRMWLGGKKLSVDIFAIHPPLITWIFAIAVFISMHVGFLEDYHALVLMGLCAVAFTTFICDIIIQDHPAFTDKKKKRAQFALLLCAVFIFYTSPVYFFDREHIFLVLAFPYMLCLSPSLYRQSRPLWLRNVIGIMAAIGFCIKPHCLLVFAGLQLISIIRERSLAMLMSLESLIIYMVTVLYMALIWFLTPEYFTVVVPMLMATYSGYNARIGGVYFFIVALFTFAVTFVDFRLRYTSPYRKDILYFVAVSVVLLAYALVNHGWGYTYNPLVSVILITTGWVLWEFNYLKKEYKSHGLPFKQFVFGIRACSINFAVNAAIILFVCFQALTVKCEEHRDCLLTDKLLQAVQEQHAHSFGVLSVEFDRWAILSRQSGIKWETRFPHLWMLPKFIMSDNEFTKQHQDMLEYVANGFAEDLQKNKPDIIFVDAGDEFYSTGKNVDLVAYFSVFPHFKEAYQQYRFLESIEECHSAGEIDKLMEAARKNSKKKSCKYDLYIRKS